MTFWQFVEVHGVFITTLGLLLFKTATNALPPKGEPFLFGQWFMEWMREIAQQAPTKVTPQQQETLALAGQPVVK